MGSKRRQVPDEGIRAAVDRLLREFGIPEEAPHPDEQKRDAFDPPTVKSQPNPGKK